MGYFCYRGKFDWIVLVFGYFKGLYVYLKSWCCLSREGVFCSFRRGGGGVDDFRVLLSFKVWLVMVGFWGMGF